MSNKKLRKKIGLILLTCAMSFSTLVPAMAADTEKATEETVTEAPVKPEAQSQTEAPAQTETTAPETQAPVQETQPQTEAQTEAQTQPQTEAVTEETIVEETSAETEAETKKESEKDNKKENKPDKKESKNEDPLIEDAEKETAKPIAELYVDPNSYPAYDMNDNVISIYRYLVDELGLNHAAACGVVANIHLESKFNPLAIGDSGTSYGICQWHLGRLSALMNFCKSNGMDYHTLKGQLAFMKHELKNGYSGVLSYLKGLGNTKEDAFAAGHYWCMYYEIPSQTAARAERRGNLARNEYFDQSFDLEFDIERVLVTTSRVNVREKADADSKSLGLLEKGTKVDAKEEQNNGTWLAVNYEDKDGFVHRDYVGEEEIKVPKSEKVNTVKAETEEEKAEPVEADIAAVAETEEVTEATDAVTVEDTVSVEDATGAEEISETEIVSAKEETVADAGTVEPSAVTDLYLREKASADSKALDIIHKGDVVKRTGVENGWASVEFADQNGYVKDAYLNPAFNKAEPETEATAETETETETEEETEVITEAKETEKAEKTEKEEGTAIATTALYLRENADADSKAIATIKKGEKVEKKETIGKWTHVSYGDKEGFVRSDFLKDQKAGETYIVAATAVYGWTEPSYSSSKVLTLEAGEEALVLDETENWVNVSFEGKIGWMEKCFVRF